MIKGTIQQEDITLVNIYAPNIGAHKYEKILMDIKGDIDSNAVIVGDFNTPLTSLDTPSTQKINKETAALNDTLDQMDLIDVLRAFHPKAADCTYFSSAHGIFSRIDHMLGHKTSLNKIKKIEIISSIFSDYNAMKLESNHKNNEKHAKT